MDCYDAYREPPKGCGTTIIGIIGIALIAAMFIFSGCKSVQTQTEYKERTVEVRVRDTIITTQADSASIRALLRCDSAYNVVIDELTTLQGTRIKADVKTQGVPNRVSNGVSNALQIDLNCKEDSMRIVCHMKDSIISNLEKQVQVLSVPRDRTGYDRFCSWWFWITAILLLLKLAAWVMEKFPATAPYILIARKFVPFL